MSIVLANKNATAGDTACRMLQRRARGRVIGVFSQGIYCRMGEDILLLHDAKWGCVPFGIGLPDFAAFAEAVNATVGDEVALGEESIKVGEKRVAVAITKSEKPPREKLPLPTAERLAAMESYILANGSHGGMLELIAQNRASVRDTIAALVAGDADAAVRLIGLGRGLTPSGDDFLCGFFALLDALQEAGFDTAREAVLAHLDRTTDISAAYIRSALGGEYFTVYDRAARAFLSAEPFALHCDFVLAMGASSGTDTLLGALTAAKMLSDVR